MHCWQWEGHTVPTPCAGNLTLWMHLCLCYKLVAKLGHSLSKRLTVSSCQSKQAKGQVKDYAVKLPQLGSLSWFGLTGSRAGQDGVRSKPSWWPEVGGTHITDRQGSMLLDGHCWGDNLGSQSLQFRVGHLWPLGEGSCHSVCGH